MPKPVSITAILTSLSGIAITIYYRLENKAYWELGIGLLDVFFLFGLGTIAGILCCWKRSMPYGQGILIGIGMVLLTGLSVCSFA